MQGQAAAVAAIPTFDLAQLSFPLKITALLRDTQLCKSASEARRQVAGGAVRLDGCKLEDPDVTFETASELKEQVLQVGKKQFLRLI